MTKPVGRLTRAQLAPFEEEPKPQTPERLPAKTTEKPPSESPTTSQAKTGELSSPKVPEALTKRTGVLKVQLKPSKPVPKPQTATAPQRAGPSPVVPRAVKWDDVVLRLTTTATGGLEAEFPYARAGDQDTPHRARRKGGAASPRREYAGQRHRGARRYRVRRAPAATFDLGGRSASRRRPQAEGVHGPPGQERHRQSRLGGLSLDGPVADGNAGGYGGFASGQIPRLGRAE